MELVSQMITIQDGREIDIKPMLREKVHFVAFIEYEGQNCFFEAIGRLDCAEGAEIHFSQMSCIKTEISDPYFASSVKDGLWFYNRNLLLLEKEGTPNR